MKIGGVTQKVNIPFHRERIPQKIEIPVNVDGKVELAEFVTTTDGIIQRTAVLVKNNKVSLPDKDTLEVEMIRNTLENNSLVNMRDFYKKNKV